MMDARKAWMSVAILWVFYILSSIDRSLLLILVQPIKQDLGASDFAMGILIGPAFGVFYSIAGLPMGHFVDRYRIRPLLFVGVIAWSLATAACGLATHYGWLFLARMCVGVGEAVLAPAAYTLISSI